MSSESKKGPQATLPAVPSELGQSAARYLLAIARLAETHDERITTGDVQEHLGVTAASVSEMHSKLEERGLVDYEKYRGVTLTERGETFATQLAWQFCVVSTFFESVVDADIDQQTAFAIAFTLPEEGLSSLRELISAPCLTLCPEATGESEQCLC